MCVCVRVYCAFWVWLVCMNVCVCGCFNIDAGAFECVGSDERACTHWLARAGLHARARACMSRHLSESVDECAGLVIHDLYFKLCYHFQLYYQSTNVKCWYLLLQFWCWKQNALDHMGYPSWNIFSSTANSTMWVSTQGVCISTLCGKHYDWTCKTIDIYCICHYLIKLI